MTEQERLRLQVELQAKEIQELAQMVHNLKQLVGYGFVAMAMSFFILAMR